MVVIVLQFRAQLENVRSIEFPSDLEWCLDIQQSNSDEVRKKITLTRVDSYPIPGSRGEAHLVMKWPESRKPATISIVDVKGLQGLYENDDSGQYKPVVAFECRGMEPINWSPMGPYRVETVSGKILDAGFAEKEWFDYDEDAQLPVSVSEIEWKFEAHK